jgi:hypothetical protein
MSQLELNISIFSCDMNKSVIVGLVVFGGLGYAWQSGAIPRGGSGYQVEFAGLRDENRGRGNS